MASVLQSTTPGKGDPTRPWARISGGGGAELTVRAPDSFALDTAIADRTGAHHVVGATYAIGSVDGAEVAISGDCRQENAAGESVVIATCIVDLLSGGKVLETQKHRLPVAVGPFDVEFVFESGEDLADELRVKFYVNRESRGLLEISGVRVHVMPLLVEAAPAFDLEPFRAAAAWPGTTSMSWLSGKSMYVAAGCEMTYVCDHLEQGGLQVHHTYQMNEAMDPVMEAANPASVLWTTRPDFMVLSPVQHFRSILSKHERSRAAVDREQLEARLDEYLEDLAGVVTRLRDSVYCPIWILSHIYTATSPLGVHDYRVKDGSISPYELVLLFKLKLYAFARRFKGVYVLDPDLAFEAAGKRPGGKAHVRRFETLGGHPELAGARYIAEYLHHQMLVLYKGAPRIKCVVVDCDNTLWQGVIREDGAAGVTIERTRMQRLWHLGLRGIPIALCSKNDPEDEALILDMVKSYSRLHQKVVTTRLNWLPKSENIRSIAEQLNIGLDSIAFFDDSDFEREEVKTALPDVHVFPETAIVEAPDWYLFQPRGDLSKEGMGRVKKYKEEASRTEFQSEFSSDTTGFEQFLHSCELRLEARRGQAAELSRVSELLQRTNQMNATMKRLNDAEVARFHEDPERAVHIVKLGDRFGDYGLIGTALSERQNGTLNVVELALSCRAMGRRVEDALLEELIGFAADTGAERVAIGATRTSRNQQIFETLERVGFAPSDPDAEEGAVVTWELDLAATERRGREFAAWFRWDDNIDDLE